MASFRSIYEAEAARRIGRCDPLPPVTEKDLAKLPPLIAHYLRRCGVVGWPRPNNVRALWRGQMKPKPGAAWMPVTAEQYNFFDPPARLFLMRGHLSGIPFDGLHMYVGSAATMRIRIAGILPIATAEGALMNQSETVTMFNDLCLLAPAALIDADVHWNVVDERRVRGTFRNAGNTISAILTFDESGDLVNFLSHDRYQSADGKTYKLYPWSTPVADYRNFRGIRLPSRGVAIWAEPAGEYAYGRLELVDVRYNATHLATHTAA